MELLVLLLVMEVEVEVEAEMEEEAIQERRVVELKVNNQVKSQMKLIFYLIRNPPLI